MNNEATISGLKAVIRRLEMEKRQIEEQHRALVMALRYVEDAGDRPEPHSQRTERLFSSDMRDAMSDILAREGPLHRSTIHDRLVEMGVHIGGRDPVHNVGAHLSVDSRFRNVGRGMWDLAEPHGAVVQSERLSASLRPDDTGDRDSLADKDYQDNSDEEDSVAW